LKEQLKLSKVRSALRKFKTLVRLVLLDDKVLKLALEEEFKELKMEFNTTLPSKNSCEAIITRNKKDFKNSSIPILNAAVFVKLQR